MEQNTLPDPDTYYASLSYPERLVFDQLVGDRTRKEVFEEVHAVMQLLTITAGFTIDRLQDLIEDFKAARQQVKDQKVERIRAECRGQVPPIQPTIPQLIGWIFKFPKTDNPNLVKNIRLERMDMELTSTGTSFPESLIKHSDNSSVQLSPKVFFQLSAVATTDIALPYSIAFLHTRPCVIDAPDLEMADLEGYFPWADLAMLERSKVADYADYVLYGPASTYNDLFFSGARLDYRTMHHPNMRLEQLNLKNRATGNIVWPESKTPFTLKVEPYIADATTRKQWVPQKGSDPLPDDQSGAGMISSLNASAPVARSAGGPDDVESPPISSHMFPCPTVWEYSNEVAAIAARQTGSNEVAPMMAYRTAFYQRFSGAEVSSKPISVASVTLASRPRTLPVQDPDDDDKPGNSNKGCLGMALAIVLLIICLLV